jgi:DNA-binding NarL/FixJ family response regulator
MGDLVEEVRGETDNAKRRGVVIVDDHAIVREGLAELIRREPDLAIDGVAAASAEALSLFDACAESGSLPDVAIVDLSLGKDSGLELVKVIAQRYPKVSVVVLSMHDENLFAERSLRAGARGYVMKDAATDVLLNAVRTVLAGQLFLSEAASTRLLNTLAAQKPTERERPSANSLGNFTDRELEIFRLLGTGLVAREIAKRLQVSIKTIETHRSRIKEKLGVRRASEVVALAAQWMHTAGVHEES